MKRSFAVIVLLVLVVGLCAPAAMAQALSTVKGVCTDQEGKPIEGAIVEFKNTENGRKYSLKTNKKGEYFSIGIEFGTYDVTVNRDGKVLATQNSFKVTGDEGSLDFDLSKMQAAQQAGITEEQMKRLTPEQQKQIQEQQAQQEKVRKENEVIKSLNERLAAANQAMKAEPPDYDAAVHALTEATQLDASRDVLWARLADAYAGSAAKQTDSAERSRRYSEAVTDYQKAVELKQKASESGQQKPEDAKTLAAYHNNLAQAEARTGKTEDAVKDYEKAAQLNPAGAAQYYYNQGAVLTNAGRIDEANAAFDKAIAADPTKAEAYYQKGVNLIGKATTDPKTGKVIPVAGTEAALNKYLELQPTGPFADGAKALLQSIGGSVETTYGKKKATTKK